MDVSLKLAGETQLNDLCCFWTGWDFLPPRKEILVVKFNTNESSKLPTSECCFMSLLLPIGHNTYQEFMNCMDTAIRYGSKGFSFA